jgi:hypothetical protein
MPMDRRTVNYAEIVGNVNSNSIPPVGDNGRTWECTVDELNFAFNTIERSCGVGDL